MVLLWFHLFYFRLFFLASFWSWILAVIFLISDHRRLMAYLQLHRRVLLVSFRKIDVTMSGYSTWVSPHLCIARNSPHRILRKTNISGVTQQLQQIFSLPRLPLQQDGHSGRRECDYISANDQQFWCAVARVVNGVWFFSLSEWFSFAWLDWLRLRLPLNWFYFVHDFIITSLSSS